MVGDGPVGIDALLDDLADGIRLHDVDSLERGDDSLLGRRQRRRRCGETNVGTPLGGGLIERGSQIGQAALAADRGRLPGRPRLASADFDSRIFQLLDAGVDERGTDPWTPRIAHDVDQLASRRPVRVDAIKCGFGETRRLRLGGCPAV